MPIDPNTYIETNSEYHEGIALEEYGGAYYIVRCQEGKDGNVYPRWMKIQTGKDKFADKATPWKIGLGDKTEAVNILKRLLLHFGGEAPMPTVDDDDEIPF